MPEPNAKSTDPARLSIATFGVLFSLTALAGIAITNLSNVQATDNTSDDSVTITVGSSCTLFGDDNVYNSSLNPGQETGDLGPSNIKVVCNDGYGFSVYAIGYSGNSYTGQNHTKLIGTNSTISTGTSGDNSWWAMKLSAVAGDYAPTIENGYSSYNVIPDTFTQVAKYTGATDTGSEATGSNLQAYYKVKASVGQIADTYTGRVKYTLVHPNNFTFGDYNINYLANGGTGTMASQTDLPNYENQTLSPLSSGTITPPAGYKFIGWCTVQDASASATNPQTTCPGSHYTDADTVPSGSISASTTSTTNLNLYAYYNQITSQITLNQNGATTSSVPTTLTATYGKSTISPATITNPEKSYSVSGFTMGTAASDATVTFPSTGNCTSASNCSYSNTFNGWYNTNSSTGGTQIITTSNALTPNNGWTDANSNWTETDDKTVYARWAAGTAITLPTITKTGYTCGWSENSSASTYTYQSGYSGLVPTTNMTLYGICEIKSNLSLKVSFDSHVSQIQVRQGSTTGTLIATVTTSGTNVSGLLYNANYYLIPTYASGYELDAWSQDTGTVNYPNSLSSTSAANPYYTIGDGSNGVTLASKQSCQSTISGTMQDFDPSTLCSGVTSGTLTDPRGTTQSYTVAKLADGKWWMTENLNLAGGAALSASDTNVDPSYISSFSTSNNLTKSGDTIVLPASSTSGFNTNNYSYVYNSGNKTSNCASPGCYSYYSWDAATLGSGRSISTDNTDAPYSICPKNWRLPTSRTTSATNWQTTSDFYVMAHQYGLDSTTSISESDSDFYNQAGPGTTPNFLLAGYYLSGSFYGGGSYGGYWSSTSYSSTSRARYLLFSSSTVGSADYNSRFYGSSVRCLFSS